jgi:hypothetical protein
LPKLRSCSALPRHFGLALDQPDDRVESFGEGSAERDKLEDRALSRVERR